MVIFQSIWSSTAFGAACAFCVYGATYLALGERANRLPAGAVIPAIFLSPWWPALCAGIAVHAAGIMLTNRYRRRKSPAGLKIVIGLAVLGFWGMMSYTTVALANGIAGEIRSNDAAAWIQVSHSGAAGAFVETHYRPCTEHSNSILMPFMRVPGSGHIAQADPTVCAASTIVLARESGGDSFANEVSVIIRDLPDILALSPASQAKLDQLMHE